VDYSNADHTERWSLQLKAAGGGVPGVGTYTNVVGTDEWNSGAVAMDFSNNGSGCTGLTGSFEVLEIEVSGGKVLRLAADFDQTCLFTNPTAPLHGSIRFNSSLPIRR
jgi:hypothetical protein